MNIAQEIRQTKARPARFLIGLFVLGLASSSVIGKQQIVVFMEAKPRAKQEAPAPAPSQTTPSTMENITFKLRLIGDAICAQLRTSIAAIRTYGSRDLLYLLQMETHSPSRAFHSRQSSGRRRNSSPP